MRNHAYKQYNQKEYAFKELQAEKPNLKVYSTPLRQRLISKLRVLNKKLSFYAVIGLLVGGLSQFTLTEVESKMDKRFQEVNNMMRVRQDLENFLGRTYSWQNLRKEANKNNLTDTKEIYQSQEDKILR